MAKSVTPLRTISSLHLLARIDVGPDAFRYFAQCGYQSTNRKEFTDGKKAGCVECRHVAGWDEDETAE